MDDLIKAVLETDTLGPPEDVRKRVLHKVLNTAHMPLPLLDYLEGTWFNSFILYSLYIIKEGQSEEIVF